jgi:hypothetical protein
MTSCLSSSDERQVFRVSYLVFPYLFAVRSKNVGELSGLHRFILRAKEAKPTASRRFFVRMKSDRACPWLEKV